MSGFAGSIVGGIGTLIREYIQSVGFVAGVSGWRISKNGDAEFNNIFVRGTIELPLVASQGEIGTLWWNDGLTVEHAQIFKTLSHVLFMSGGSNNPTLGHDSFIALGEESVAGDDSRLQLSNDGGRSAPNGSEILLDQGIQLFSPSLSAVSTDRGPEIFLGAGELDLVGPGIGGVGWVGVLITASGLTIGAGVSGKYYSEEVSFGGQNIPNAAVTQLVTLSSLHLNSDYGSAWNLVTGVWTCPVSGDYDFTISSAYTGGAVGSRIINRMGTTFNTAPFIGGFDITTPSATMENTVSFTKFIAAGTTLHAEVFQNSGAARLIDTTQSYIKIARRL